MTAGEFLRELGARTGWIQQWLMAAAALMIVTIAAAVPSRAGMPEPAADVAGVVMAAAVLGLLWGLCGIRLVQEFVLDGRPGRRGQSGPGTG